MKALIGGLVALISGLIGLILWRLQFLNLLAGAIPLLLLLCGAFAIYLGYEEAKDKMFKKAETQNYKPPKVNEAKVEQYKGNIGPL